MKKIILTLSMVIFIFYWVITLIFTLPENYITISLGKENRIFNTFFFQRWGFFAPPPNYNERLYYTFVNDKSRLQDLTFEVLQPLNYQNSKNKIFNYESDILDYVLSNSITNITETISEVNKVYKYKEGEKSLNDSTYAKFLSNAIISSPQFITLKNYAKLVATKNNVPKKNNHVMITLTTIPLPKFHQRNDNKIVCKEEIVFKSIPLSI
jgi:hypothetical protein